MFYMSTEHFLFILSDTTILYILFWKLFHIKSQLQHLYYEASFFIYEKVLLSSAS
jgi:hypothetical protein